MRFIKLIMYLILVIFGVSFAALNAENVALNFYFKQINLPVSVLLIISFGIGVILGFIVFYARYWRLKVEFRALKHHLSLTEKELKNIRAIPLDDKH